MEKESRIRGGPVQRPKQKAAPAKGTAESQTAMHYAGRIYGEYVMVR